MTNDIPIMSARHVTVEFNTAAGVLTAVSDVSLDLYRGETLAIVGESGSGKSTLAAAMMRAFTPSSGQIIFDGEDITKTDDRHLKSLRRRFQMVLQDPYSSLDPRMTVERIMAEPLRAHGLRSRREIRDRSLEILGRVGLPASALSRYPAQFSGGQRQRISIARALMLRPSVIIADEPVSALDVSIQAQIVELLNEIQEVDNIAYLIIAHDLALVHHISDRIAVMYLGKIVEQGYTARVIAAPQHPYTASLLSATPLAHNDKRERIVLSGEQPSPIDLPTGCPFHTRCPIARPICAVKVPPMSELRPGHMAACFFPGELDAGLPSPVQDSLLAHLRESSAPS